MSLTRLARRLCGVAASGSPACSGLLPALSGTSSSLGAAGARHMSSNSSSPTQQPVQFTPRELTEEHIRKIGELDEKMRQAYDAMPSAFPAHAQADSTHAVDAEAAFRKRLLYRSKQRGWLEVDLLMGAWADAHLGGLSSTELREYERILNLETIDLYNYVTGKDSPPAEHATPLMMRLIAFCKSSPLGKADPAAYARAKRIFTN